MMLSKKILLLLAVSLATNFTFAQQRKSENPADKKQVINWNTEEGLIRGLEMMQQKKQLNDHIKITDLVLADDSAGGTEVTIKMPLVYEDI